MKKIKLGLNKKTGPDRVTQGNAIKTAMTGNANFTTPNPTLAAVGTATTNVQTKLTAREAAIEAAKLATEDLHAATEAYDAIMTQLAAYAENITGGDPVKLLSGGFEVRKSPTPIGELGRVENLKVFGNGFPAQLKARWDPLRGAKSYEVQVTSTPDLEASWKAVIPSPASNTAIEGLTSGTRVHVRVRGVARKKTGPFSSAIDCIVP